MSKLCLPYALRGLLRWREGDLDKAEERFRRAHELAEQVGWSELSFQALYGLALTLRDRGDHADAVTALGQAIDVCERAGLAAQSVQATATRAVVLALGGRWEAARESAAEAEGLAERLHYPIGKAAALEARGASDADPDARAPTCWSRRRTPGRSWSARSRPPRCRLLAGFRLREADPERARRAAGELSGVLRAPGSGAPGGEGARELAERRLSRIWPVSDGPDVRYWVLSAPATTTTVASPAKPLTLGVDRLALRDLQPLAHVGRLPLRAGRVLHDRLGALLVDEVRDRCRAGSPGARSSRRSGRRGRARWCR